MGWFTRKPNAALQAEFVEVAKDAFTMFGSAIEHKTTNPLRSKPHEVLDLTVEENRDAIRAELVRIIHDYGLEGCNEEEISEVRLKPVSPETPTGPVEAGNCNRRTFVCIRDEQYKLDCQKILRGFSAV